MSDIVRILCGTSYHHVPLDEAVQLLVDYLGVRYMPQQTTGAYLFKPIEHKEDGDDEKT